MKNIILLSSLLYNITVLSQFSIESSINFIHTGRNQSLEFKYKKNKNTLSLGLKYNFNNLTKFPNQNVYKKAFIYLTPNDRIGYNLNYDYNLINIKNTSVNLFYNFEMFKSHKLNDWFYAIGSFVPNPTSEQDFVYVRVTDTLSPIWVFESNFGIKLNIFLTQNIYLTQRFGGGIVFFYDNNSTITGINNKPVKLNWELSEKISFGIGYQFNKSS